MGSITQMAEGEGAMIEVDEKQEANSPWDAGLLPDPTVQPSAQPQPADKACQRCQQNGLDCIVSPSLSLGAIFPEASRLILYRLITQHSADQHKNARA